MWFSLLTSQVIGPLCVFPSLRADEQPLHCCCPPTCSWDFHAVGRTQLRLSETAFFSYSGCSTAVLMDARRHSLVFRVLVNHADFTGKCQLKCFSCLKGYGFVTIVDLQDLSEYNLAFFLHSIKLPFVDFFFFFMVTHTCVFVCLCTNLLIQCCACAVALLKVRGQLSGVSLFILWTWVRAWAQ